jgi:NAD(P)H-flavin reductase
MRTGSASAPKQHLICEVLGNDPLNAEIFRLDIAWSGTPPKAGQFFLIRPERSAVFLGRPISVAMWEPAMEDEEGISRKLRGKSHERIRFLTTPSVRFMIAWRGRGSAELASLRFGDKVELTGPLGNAWAEMLAAQDGGGKKDAAESGKIALVGGGIGIAPLIALVSELRDRSCDFYAGFKTMGTKRMDPEFDKLLGPALFHAKELILATENGTRGEKGRIPDFLEPGRYRAVCACGPEPMLKAVAAKCKAAGVPCFISMEKRMACGVGACLGCTVKTIQGNRRCCADGPIFPAEEILFDE